jgi:hypothetical protein
MGGLPNLLHVLSSEALDLFVQRSYAKSFLSKHQDVAEVWSDERHPALS